MAFKSTEIAVLLNAIPILKQTPENVDQELLISSFKEYSDVILPKIIEILEQVKAKGELSPNSNFRSVETKVLNGKNSLSVTWNAALNNQWSSGVTISDGGFIQIIFEPNEEGNLSVYDANTEDKVPLDSPQSLVKPIPAGRRNFGSALDWLGVLIPAINQVEEKLNPPAN